jgi:hypothetical protein
MAIPVINIGSKLDGKGFKQAETATEKLGKNAKKLAGALGLAFGTAQVIAFAKASMKAFAEDEKAAVRLTKAVENLGLGFEDARIKSFISDLEATAGVSDDVLRPAFQSLLQTTGSVTKSQELLKLALDVSAGSGIDAAEVSKDLGLAYLGQTKGLAKYNTGLTKAELNTKNFADIQTVLNEQFAGQNAARLDTYAGKMEMLGVAAGNAKEIIGKGIIDALSMLGEDTSVSKLADDMTRAAESTANVIRGIGVLADKLKVIPGFDSKDWEYVYNISYFKFLNDLGKAEALKPKPFSIPMTISGSTDAEVKAAEARKKAEQEARKRALELLKIKNKQLESERKALATKRLANAIDKANLLLNKGEGIFDLEKIQIGAALTNQADQLGKVTNQSQLLAIANDVARLNVKKSMLALEDAIAAKDEAAIIAATAKLNEDIKILNALSGQNTKLTDIKSILDSLKPKDLINLTNLDAALAKITEMLRLLAQANAAATAKVPTSASLGSGIPANDYIAPIPMSVGLNASTAALIEASEAIQARADAFSMLLDLQTEADTAALAASSIGAAALNTFNIEDVARSSLLQGLAGGAGVSGAMSGSRYAAQAANAYNITINAGLGSDPEAIARGLEDVLNQSSYRGTSVNRGSGNYVL